MDQEEVFSLAERFGRVRNCLLLRIKNQALLEMSDQGVAMAMVASYTASPPVMRLVGLRGVFHFIHIDRINTTVAPI